MKFKFKIQKYQTDAVEATADVFAGQPNRTAKYTRDLGMRRDRQKTFDDKMGIKHIFFVAETKGSMSSMDLRPRALIDAAASFLQSSRACRHRRQAEARGSFVVRVF